MEKARVGSSVAEGKEAKVNKGPEIDLRRQREARREVGDV